MIPEIKNKNKKYRLKICEMFKPVSFLKDKVIIEEGAVANKVYIIRKGELRIVSTEIRKLAETMLEPKRGPKSLRNQQKFGSTAEIISSKRRNSAENQIQGDKFSKI